MLFVCLGNTANAESVENEKALSIIYDTKIAGIGFNSSVEDINNALSQDEIPMDCEYSEYLVVPKTRLKKKITKETFYQNWNCKYIDGMKHKMLDVRTINGIVTTLLYRGSIVSSLDKKDMFSYYRDIDKNLVVTGLVHDDHNFVFEDIVSATYIQQRLRVRLLTRCHGGLTGVVFEETLTEMPVQKAFTIEVKYERQSCP
ncbi:MAG: hypothetical protein COA95_04940 [Methylophaga sp.]|nr:MAG: hypothetical protein COA95_04940 [Methylophaga sp.]